MPGEILSNPLSVAAHRARSGRGVSLCWFTDKFHSSVLSREKRSCHVRLVRHKHQQLRKHRLAAHYDDPYRFVCLTVRVSLGILGLGGCCRGREWTNSRDNGPDRPEGYQPEPQLFRTSLTELGVSRRWFKSHVDSSYGVRIRLPAYRKVRKPRSSYSSKQTSSKDAFASLDSVPELSRDRALTGFGLLSVTSEASKRLPASFKVLCGWSRVSDMSTTKNAR